MKVQSPSGSSPSAPYLARNTSEAQVRPVSEQILNARPAREDTHARIELDSTDESLIDIDPDIDPTNVIIDVDSPDIPSNFPAGEALASDLRAWWQNAQRLAPEAKLEGLKGRFTSEGLATKLLALLGFHQSGLEFRAAQPNAQPASPDGDAPDFELQKAVYALLAESDHENQVIPLLIEAASNSNTVAGDIVQVYNAILVARRCGLPEAQAEKWLRQNPSITHERVRDALNSLIGQLPGKGRDFAQGVSHEMKYGNQTEHVQPTPMTTEALLKTAASILFNGPREGLSQYLAQVLMHALFLAAFLKLHISVQCLLSGGALFFTQIFGYLRVDSQKSDEYRAHPVKSFTVQQGFSLGLPLFAVATPLFAACLGLPPQVIDVLQSGANLQIRKRLANVFRELAQTYTRSHLTAGFDFLHADGSGLTAREQWWVNLVRDLLYTITSVLLLFVGPVLAKEWLAQAAASVTDTCSAFQAAALLNIFTGLNDMCEGWSMDMARVICRLLWGDDYILQPGDQYNPRTNPDMWANHTASRFITGPIIDFLLWLAEALEKAGVSPHAVRLVQFLAAAINGLVGGLRGRVISMVNWNGPDGPVPVTEEGQKESGRRGNREPRGLASWIFDTVRSNVNAGVNAAWDLSGAGAYANAWAAVKTSWTR